MINTEWHQVNLLKSNATADERLAYHRDHASVCDCLPIPADLYDALSTQVQPSE